MSSAQIYKTSSYLERETSFNRVKSHVMKRFLVIARNDIFI